jgi:hypothetical protein
MTSRNASSTRASCGARRWRHETTQHRSPRSPVRTRSAPSRHGSARPLLAHLVGCRTRRPGVERAGSGCRRAGRQEAARTDDRGRLTPRRVDPRQACPRCRHAHREAQGLARAARLRQLRSGASPQADPALAFTALRRALMSSIELLRAYWHGGPLLARRERSFRHPSPAPRIATAAIPSASSSLRMSTQHSATRCIARRPPLSVVVTAAMSQSTTRQRALPMHPTSANGHADDHHDKRAMRPTQGPFRHSPESEVPQCSVLSHALTVHWWGSLTCGSRFAWPRR